MGFSVGPFPLQPRTWPRLVHVTILLALAFAIGAANPVAEAKRDDRERSGAKQRGRSGERGAGQHGKQKDAAQPRAHKPQHEGKHKRAKSNDRPKSKPAKPDAKPADEPKQDQPDRSPTRGPAAPPQTEEPPAEQPRPAPARPSIPSLPTAPVAGTLPASGPVLSPVAQLPATAPERRRGARRQGRQRAVETTAGGALPLAAGGAGGLTPGLTGAEPLQPLSGLEEQSATAEATAEPDDGAGAAETVTRTVRDIVEVVPDSLKLALAALAALSIMLGGWSLFAGLRSRRLDAQRRQLLQEVGLLQKALLPPVPDVMGALHTSVAYRPAEGPGAGGDFYDVVPLAGGRTAFILGDIAGHGRDALERTAFVRYTLRAYIEAGLQPRVALGVAGRVIDDHLDGGFATVLVAIHDPASGSLAYASAGHPAPIVVGPSAYEPVLAASSPPIGVGVRTGLRQSTLPLAPGSVACLFTDGLTEARTQDGLIGRGRLSDLVEELGREGTAEELLERIAAESRVISDDMAACLIAPTAGVTAGGFRTEQLELSEVDVEQGHGERFLLACKLSEEEIEETLVEAVAQARRHGGAVLHVTFGNRVSVEVLPRNVESIEAASRRAAASARG